MSTATKGFASASKAQRRAVSSKGGKRVQELGLGHQWTAAEASEAGKKGLRKRRRLAVMAAALRLMKEHGFTPDQLNGLGLSDSEYLEYGGVKSTLEDVDKLRNRVNYAEIERNSQTPNS